MCPAKHVQEAVRNCAVHLLSNFGGKLRMPRKVKNPFKIGYDPELDISAELEPETSTYF